MHVCTFVDVVAGDPRDVCTKFGNTHYLGTTLHTLVWAAVKGAMYGMAGGD